MSAEDGEFLALARSMGFRRFTGGDGFETIQARFNYRLDLRGHTEETLLAHFTQKTRYNIRLAQKHGVRVRVEGAERLDDFMRLMEVTGRRGRFAGRAKCYFLRKLTALETGPACTWPIIRTGRFRAPLPLILPKDRLCLRALPITSPGR